tara:strand:+ start:9948 stop:11435 length:1488 start_codon:yes stop_codon:yes gene_type:complete
MTEKVSTENQLRNVRLQKIEKFKEMGINPYPYKYKRTGIATDLHEKYKDLKDDTETTDVVRIAGRIMAIRNSGMFIDLLDESGRIQVFTHKNGVSEEIIAIAKLLDIGDWIGIEGIVRRTKRGELTINTQNMELLCKSLLPLPEKYHGLTDIEKRYRQRYIDLIVTPESRDRLRTRSRVISDIRHYLANQGFLEVETPMLHVIPGGATAKPFVTHHKAYGMDMYLRVAPELHLKRLIIGGLSDKVFEINRCFRNEGVSPRHNPEFTMVEMYQAFADFEDMMDLTENIVIHICEKVLGTYEVPYGDTIINFKGPWQRKSMLTLVKEATGVDFDTFKTAEEALAAAKEIGKIPLTGKESWGHVVEAVFAEKVEPNLMQPTHVTELPLDISPLAKVHRDNPRLTERFETFVNTWEIANAFSELNDPIDQHQRFEGQVAQREAGDEEAQHMDKDFINALEHGMPPTGGLGIGIDRLIMLLTNATSIRDVIAFPTMKPKD